MPFDPCGCVMDVLRANYNTFIKPFRDSSIQVPIRWYFCDPGAKLMPWHRFSSLNWEPYKGDYDPSSFVLPQDYVGEVMTPRGVRPKRKFSKGTKPFPVGFEGVRFCGPLEFFQNGALWSQRRPLVGVDCPPCQGPCSDFSSVFTDVSGLPDYFPDVTLGAYDSQMLFAHPSAWSGTLWSNALFDPTVTPVQAIVGDPLNPTDFFLIEQGTAIPVGWTQVTEFVSSFEDVVFALQGLGFLIDFLCDHTCTPVSSLYNRDLPGPGLTVLFEFKDNNSTNSVFIPFVIDVRYSVKPYNFPDNDGTIWTNTLDEVNCNATGTQIMNAGGLMVFVSNLWLAQQQALGFVPFTYFYFQPNEIVTIDGLLAGLTPNGGRPLNTTSYTALSPGPGPIWDPPYPCLDF